MTSLLVVAMALSGNAQEGFTVSGKISGVPDGTLYLLTDMPQADTLATAQLANGIFMFTGKVDAPVAAYLSTADEEGMRIPMILENARFTLNVTEQGALIQGGEQQKLFARYNQIGQAFAVAQAEAQAAMQQPGANTQALQERINQAYEESLARTMELIQANPDAYATAYVIALGVMNETEESLQAKYDLLGTNAKNSVPGKQIAAALAQYGKLAVGKPAPDFTAQKLNGDTFSLYDVPAKIKLLVFWVSWDAASRQLNPELIALYQQFRPKGLDIVSISLDENRNDWERAVSVDGLFWTNGSDLKGSNSELAKLYMVTSVPYTVLIDKENTIVAKGLLGDDLRKAIFDLTKKNKNVKNVD